MDPADPLAGARLLVATDLDGNPREARIRQAVALSEAELRAVHGAAIGWREVCEWSRRERRVLARRREMFGALVLDDRPWRDAPADALARAALDGLRALGLDACGMTPAARRFQARVELLRGQGADMPDLSDAALVSGEGDWLQPHLAGCRTADDLRRFDLTEALRGLLDWDQMQMLDRLAPAHFVTPLGRRIPIDYSAGAPSIAVRLQEMFGVTAHPTVGPARLPVQITLLSPANRPVQVTTDLPGFWATSYADVRKEMRGRYPRHPWPEDPAQADPTLRARPRRN